MNVAGVLAAILDLEIGQEVAHLSITRTSAKQDLGVVRCARCTA